MDKKELSAYFSALGKRGGKNRWKGKSKASKITHMKKMAMLSHKKRNPQTISKVA